MDPIRRASAGIGVIALGASLTACLTVEPTGAGVIGECVEASSPGVTDSTIRLGVTLPLTGSAASTGVNARLGQEAAAEFVNRNGGVQGRQIELEFLDDQYLPAKAQANVRELIQQDEVFMVVGGSGTGTTLSWAPTLGQYKVPAIGPYAGSSNLGTMDTPWLYMLFPHYGDQLETLVRYAIEQNNSRKVAVVSISGDIMADAKSGVDAAVEGTEASVEYFPETPGTTNFAPLATSVRASDADLVVLMMTNGDTAGFLNATRRLGYTPNFAAWPGMADSSWIEEYGDISEGMLVANPVANPSSDAAEVDAFREEYTAITGEAPTLFNEIGWIQTMVAIDAIEQAEFLTRACVVEALNQFDSHATGLLPPLTFGPEERQGSTDVEIDVIRNGELVTVVPFAGSRD